MKVVLADIFRTINSKTWWLLAAMAVITIVEVTSLDGPNVCMVKQKYNITKRVKYRAPMAVRTYVWCFAVPPRCSRWSTEVKDLTRLETEERVAEMAVCCPGYKLKDVSCLPICPNGKTGHGCSEDCPPNKWGPNCVHDCKACEHGTCSPITGDCQCQDGWQGESCETASTTPAVMMEQLLTTAKTTIKTTIPTSTPLTTRTLEKNVETTPSTTTQSATLSTKKRVEAITTTAVTQRTTLPVTVKSIATLPNTEKPFYVNNTLTPFTTYRPITDVYKKVADISIYNRTEIPTTKTASPVIVTVVSNLTTTTEKFSTTVKASSTTALTVVTTETTPFTTVKETTTKLDTTKKLETTVRQTTTKFKPKEIWIRPAQKGESPIVESKVKTNQETPHIKYKIATKKESEENTTPKTIIVSIIPTSVSYASFKKIALTTASYTAQKSNVTIKSYNRNIEQDHTKPIIALTTTFAPTVRYTSEIPKKSNTSSTINVLLQNITKSKTHTSVPMSYSTTAFPNITTNSMSSTFHAVEKLNTSNTLTTISFSSTNVATRREPLEISTIRPHTTMRSTTLSTQNTTERPSISKQFVTIIQRNVTVKPVTDKVTDILKVTKALIRKQATNDSKNNLTDTNSKTNPVTDDPTKDEETFHILTEPEHITAVMGDKGADKASVDLISVISIAGGVMMAVITVAVVIVMLERCKKPRYEDVRKYNDISMQVMIDNNDVPPPYVRSIFHTPLPEPPTSEKCHYQPISTLDRNLKQFMRPVVVQTISPLMLENFRGILECHYDHLPRRSHDLEPLQVRRSVAPSIEERQELLHHRAHSLTESAIEAMKCEAKLDVIDNTTSEPLYAEIPCWRPPSEHAIEIVNLNGEAVTEL